MMEERNTRYNLRAMHSVTAHPVWNNPGISMEKPGFFVALFLGGDPATADKPGIQTMT